MHKLIVILLLGSFTNIFGQIKNTNPDYPYLKPKPEMSKSLFDVGLYDKDSFLLKNIIELPNIEIYRLPLYRKRNGNEEKFRLVSYQDISELFQTYILFDDHCSEAGCYMLYTIDSLGYVINSFQFEGGDGYEFGGYFTSSKFLSDTLILNSYSVYRREKDTSGNYLKTWEIETTDTKYSISKSGEIYINSKESTLRRNQERWY